MILSSSGVVTEFSNLYLGKLNDGKCFNLPHLKMHVFKRSLNFASLLKRLLLSLSVCKFMVDHHSYTHNLSSCEIIG